MNNNNSVSQGELINYGLQFTGHVISNLIVQTQGDPQQLTQYINAIEFVVSTLAPRIASVLSTSTWTAPMSQAPLQTGSFAAARRAV